MITPNPARIFVTLCAYQREEIFSKVVEGEMQLNPSGEIVREEWLKTTKIRSNVELHEDEFVIMPNHVHGIIWIVETQQVVTTNVPIEIPMVGATRRVAPTKGSRTLVSGSLGAILGQFKSITGKLINMLRSTRDVAVWQRNYVPRVFLGLRTRCPQRKRIEENLGLHRHQSNALAGRSIAPGCAAQSIQ